MGSTLQGTQQLGYDPLFAALAEQVKLPFIHIAQAVELARNQPVTDMAATVSLYDTVSLSTQAALRLIDGYLLNVRLQNQARLDLEPVPLSSVLYDAAEQLDTYAKANHCTLQLDIKGKYAPVMAYRPAVQAALLALGYSFIDAAISADTEDGTIAEMPVITMAANRTGAGITAGIFSAQARLSTTLLRQAKQLSGQVRQPLGSFTAGAGAGVFVADALLARLDSGIRVAQFRGQHGLAATLSPSRQLSLV